VNRWEQLLEVQAHDTTADQLIHRSKTLPERAQLDAAMADVAQLDASLAEVNERREELTRAQKRLEDEIASLGEKAQQAETKLYSGSVNIPKELQALQDDIGHIRARIRQLEDQDLELMEEAEPVDARRDALLGSRAEIDTQAGALSKQIGETEAVIEGELATVRAERDRAAAGVPSDLLAEYEHLRARLGGVAVARLNGTSCGGCHLALSAVEIDRIKSLDPDEPVHCEECGRLLVRSS
jgi:predicted  nucleic acid-binding Zn-ribbon protein